MYLFSKQINKYIYIWSHPGTLSPTVWFSILQFNLSYKIVDHPVHEKFNNYLVLWKILKKEKKRVFQRAPVIIIFSHGTVSNVAFRFKRSNEPNHKALKPIPIEIYNESSSINISKKENYIISINVVAPNSKKSS